MVKKSISGKGCRDKGNRAEAEIVNIMKGYGIPSMRVLGSGAFSGAKSDLKIGVKLTEEGTLPDKDEAIPLFRAEVKSRKTYPEYLHKDIVKSDVFAFVTSARAAPQFLFDYLEQDAVSKCVIMKRDKTPQGALKEGRYNDTHLVVMGLDDFMAMTKELYELKNGR